MRRREFVQAGMTLPIAGLGLTGCFSGASNRYLEGNFAPVLAESTVTSLDVTGIIPDELTGRFVRNGPNPNDNASRSRYHWFVGRGMVHGVRLDAGRAMWYRNRYVASGSGQTPNTSVIEHAGRTLAIVESGGLPVELDYELTSVN
ncbi:MAG: carotenoid oxygenase family protein, partial [Pseudomonadales bacterium]|nr:carotenoid oxygenase family protein [Pseudomonadales bacterium]